MVDYRRLRLNNLTSPEFRHIFLLVFWIVFGIFFSAVERLIPRTVWHPMWCPLGDKIPFCEWFFIPYMFWFVFLVGMHLYLLLFDIPAFRRFIYFIMVTYSVTMVIYLIYPTCQELRPAAFSRDNFLTRFAAGFYQFDTNTNVCPSLHCIGGFAILFAALDMPRFRQKAWPVFFTVFALLICASTVFMKQHSIVDFFAALPVTLIGWLAVYLPALLKARKNA